MLLGGSLVAPFYLVKHKGGRQMPANVFGGRVSRFYEELCRIKHQNLAGIANSKGTGLKPGVLPNRGGVYAFWWLGNKDWFSSPNCNRKISLKGPGGDRILIEINEDWLGLDADLPVPLYVGKNHANLAKRIGLHLSLKQTRLLPLNQGIEKAKAPTTTCQLRAGIEHLFPRVEDSRKLVLESVGLSYVLLDGNENAANRFYLEDLAIGMMRPPLNIDIER